MPASFTITSNHQIISRSEAWAPRAPVAKTHQHPPIDADVDRLLSPHEIAILMVLASEPRRQQGDLADLRCLVDRCLVRLDTAALAEAAACLSADGHQVVSRLGRRDRVWQRRTGNVTIACRTIAAETSAGMAHHAAR
ncbi:MarR family transcriptional regulator [Burkholderia latens]